MSQENQNQSESQEQPVQEESQEQENQVEASGEEVTEEPAKELSKEEKKLLKTLKLKVDGKEFDEELPFEIPEEHAEYFRKQLQLAKMSQKRAQQTSEMETAVNEFMEMLKTNPRAILTDPSIGLDLKKFATEIIEEEIERAKKSPEQLEKEEMQAELKRLKEERENEKKDADKQALDLKTQQQVEYYDNMISDAIKKSDLPQSELVVQKMATYMLTALKNKITITAEELVPIVQEEIFSDLQALIKALGPEKAEKFIGKEILGEIRKKNVAKVKAPTPVSKAITETGEKPKQKQDDTKGQKKTFRQMFGV